MAVTLEAEFAEAVPPLIGRASDIKQAITNLLFNALDAMPDGGAMTVRTVAKTDVVAIEVSDTGVGMDDETLLRCMEPFFTTKASRGTGMGLSTAHGVMQRHGGALEMDSKPGVGTTVRLGFPAHEDGSLHAAEGAPS